MTFYDEISNFKTVNSSEIEQIINDKCDFVLFIGRSSCPFCRIFAPKIGEVSKNINKNFYFLNSEDVTDLGLTEFREKYQIKTVPALFVFKNGEYKIVCDSSLTEKQIVNFIEE